VQVLEGFVAGAELGIARWPDRFVHLVSPGLSLGCSLLSRLSLPAASRHPKFAWLARGALLDRLTCAFPHCAAADIVGGKQDEAFGGNES